MAGTLDLTSRWNAFRRDQDDVSVDFICALLPQDADGKPPISASLLRQCLAGTRNLENGYHAELERLLVDLKAIAAEHDPYPIRWSNPNLFRELLAQRRQRPVSVRSPFVMQGPAVQPQLVDRAAIEQAASQIHGGSR